MKIFFDLDGTLIDVAPRHYHVYSEVVTELGRTPLAQSVYWRLERALRHETWAKVLLRAM
jgi:beta-phosphoglucomutase-like phosphatase (HAD superfamily)